MKQIAVIVNNKKEVLKLSTTMNAKNLASNAQYPCIATFDTYDSGNGMETDIMSLVPLTERRILEHGGYIMTKIDMEESYGE